MKKCTTDTSDGDCLSFRTEGKQQNAQLYDAFVKLWEMRFCVNLNLMIHVPNGLFTSGWLLSFSLPKLI